jgi:carbohydrate kinase (thermoresistant glucokinase family)
MKALILMGVSGSGKTTVGQLLASETGGIFLDGDDFHPPENVARMSAGIPLTDKDRQGWLVKLASLIHEADGLTIIACSALKESYREILSEAEFIFLTGSEELLAKRLADRKDHYMPPGLLKSQLKTLEVPSDIFTLDIQKSPPELVAEIRRHFQI